MVQAVDRLKPNQVLGAEAYPTLGGTARRYFFSANLAHPIPMLLSIFIAILGSLTSLKRPPGFFFKRRRIWRFLSRRFRDV